MHSRGLDFCFGGPGGREGGRWDFVIPNVFPCQFPNWFSTCSPCSQCLNPQHVPSCTSLCPICFAKTLYSSKFGTYIGGQILRHIFCEYFYINECPMFQNFFMMGQSKKFIEKKSMNLHGPSLINIESLERLSVKFGIYVCQNSFLEILYNYLIYVFITLLLSKLYIY
jgi:hypothetical protein